MHATRLGQSLIPFKTGSLVVFGSIILVLSSRLDGWGSPDLTVGKQLGLLPFTIFFLVLITIACLGRTELLLLPARWRNRLAELSLLRLGLGLVILEQCMAIALFAIEGPYFRQQGYVLSIPMLLMLIALSALALAYAAISRRADRLLLASGLIYAAGVAYSIAYFPLSPLRSDMLPLIAASDTRFLSGHFPYLLYVIGNGTDYLTYLPLTWMVYLPACILHIDLRWINVILTLSTAAIAYFTVRVQHRLYASCLLSVFLLLPYVQFRHELYVSVQWLFMALAFYFYQRQRRLLTSITLGCGAAASQLFWIFIPFYLLFLLVRKGWRASALALLLILAAAAVWILPFLLDSPQQFVFGILGHWGTNWGPGGYLPVRSYNATFWVRYALAHLGIESFRNIQRVQGAALVLLFLAALRYRPQSQTDVWRWAAAAITLFGLTNFAVWPYFYVTALFALLLSFLCTVEAGPMEASQPAVTQLKVIQPKLAP